MTTIGTMSPIRHPPPSIHPPTHQNSPNNFPTQMSPNPWDGGNPAACCLVLLCFAGTHPYAASSRRKNIHFVFPPCEMCINGGGGGGRGRGGREIAEKVVLFILSLMRARIRTTQNFYLFYHGSFALRMECRPNDNRQQEDASER